MEALLKPASSAFPLQKHSSHERGYLRKDSLISFSCNSGRKMVVSTGYQQDIQRRWNAKQGLQLSAIAGNQAGYAETEQKLPNENYVLEDDADQLSLNKQQQQHEQEDTTVTGSNGLLMHRLVTLYNFIRPYALMGIVSGILSISLLPVSSLADLTPKFFIGLLQGVTLGSLIHVYVIAINQLFDVEIDKVNKDYLPLASGEFSTRDVQAICWIVTLLSIGVVYISKSPALLLGLVANYLLGTAYSADLPFLRWKKDPSLAMPGMILWSALGVQIPYFIHIQNHILGRPGLFTKSSIFQVIMLSAYCISGMILKDIPDTEGDRQNGIDTLSIRFGQKRAFAMGTNLLYAQFAFGIIVGASSSLWFFKIASVLSHFALGLAVWYKSRQTDPTNKEEAQSFYMFFWKLISLEYLLIHFVR